MLKLSSTRLGIVIAAGLLFLGAALFLGAYRTGCLGSFSFEFAATQAGLYADTQHGARVAILRGENTARFLGPASTYDNHVKYWQHLAGDLQTSCDVVSDAQLERDLKPYRVLVLPSAVCLSAKEKNNIRVLLQDGKGVVCTWATGTRDEAGNWKGWDFLSELTGADSFQSLDSPAPWFVSFSAGSPITAGTAAGSRVQVASPERLEAVALGVDGYWSDARVFPVDSTLPVEFQGALLHRQQERGRVVWYGFQENSAVAGGDDKAIVDSTLQNSLAWAGQRAVGTLEPWPFPYHAAAVFALDVRGDCDYAGYAADSLVRARTQGTFFCWPDTLRKNPQLMRTLKRAGELAIQERPVGSTVNSWPAARLLDIQLSRWKLRWFGGTWASGFDSPEVGVNLQALRALASGRFRYYLVADDGNSVLPSILNASQSLGGRRRGKLTLVRLTRMTDDDLHFSPLGVLGLDAQWIERRVVSDFETVSALGGLYVLAYHTQGLSSPSYAPLLSELAGRLRNTEAWVATASDVAEWWAARSRISTTVSVVVPQALQVSIGFAGERPLEGAALVIYPPAGFTQAQIVSTGEQTSAARILPEPTKGRLKLVLERLEPGGTYNYELKFSP